MEKFRIIKEIFEEKIPFNKALGLQFNFEREGCVICRLPFRDDLIGDIIRPALHGGSIAALIDSAAGAAAWSRLDFDKQPSTIDLRIDYLLPAPKADLLATAEVRRVGKRIVVVNVLVETDGAEAELGPIAEGRCVFYVAQNSAHRAGQAWQMGDKTGDPP